MLSLPYVKILVVSMNLREMCQCMDHFGHSKSVIWNDANLWGHITTIWSKVQQAMCYILLNILNVLTPAYSLYELVQPYLPRQSGYNLRNENNAFHSLFSRTSSFYDSFIPFTIRLWNTLPLTITKSPKFKYL